MGKYLSGSPGFSVLLVSLIRYSVYNGKITNKANNCSWIIDLFNKRRSFICCVTRVGAEIEGLCTLLLSWARHDHRESKGLFL